MSLSKEEETKIKYFWNLGFGSAKIALLTNLESYKVRNYLLQNGLKRTQAEALEAKIRANKTPYATRYKKD